MKYSIIIPHINEWYYLDITLDSIYNKFNYSNFEIIIVDDWSDKIEDLDFIKNHPLWNKINIFFEKNLWSPNARNFWAKKATGDILIFLDSHMYFNDDFLTKLDKLLLKYKNIDLLQPIIWDIKDKKTDLSIYKIKDNLLYSYWSWPKSNWKELNFSEIKDIIETPNIAWWATIIKKKVFKKLWGFNKNFIKWWCEDLEFSMRAWLRGYKNYFTPNLFVAHYFKQSFTNTTVKTEEVLNNRLMFIYTCFSNNRRVNLMLNDLKNHYWLDFFNNINLKVLENKFFWKWLKVQKEKYLYDDDWYFEKFKDYYPFFQNKKIAILTQYTNNIECYSKYTISINNEYAKKHWYDFIVHKWEIENKSKKKFITWDKIDIIKKYLNYYEYIFWIDADAMIMNHDIKIEQFITDKNLIICSDNSNSWKTDTLNAWTFILKNSIYSEQFLNKLFEIWDKECLLDKFPAEQWVIVYIYQNNLLNIKDNITVYPETTFNSSNPAHLLYKEGQFILHMMSTDNNIRSEYFKKHYEDLKNKYLYSNI